MRRDQPVAADDRLGLAAEIGQPIAVDQDPRRPRLQRGHRPAHGEQARLQDIEPVDLLRGCEGHGPGQRPVLDLQLQGSRRAGESFFESPIPAIGRSGSRITAAA